MADNKKKSGLIECGTVQSLIERDDGYLKMLDATYGATASGEPAREACNKNRIYNAVHFDIDEVADINAPFAHTMPSPDKFAQAITNLGIGNDDTVIIYDQGGICMASCRVWWMFHTFGHENVFVLNGGRPEWLRNALPVNNKTLVPASNENYKVQKHRHDAIAQTQDIRDSMEGKKCALIIDARAESRFGNKACDFGCGTDIGHIPDSINLPFTRIINPETGKMLPPDRLRNIFEETIPSTSAPKKIIFTCGSGVTACILALAAFNAGFDIENLSVYDGSWTEWSWG